MDSNSASPTRSDTSLRILLVEDSEHDWLAFRRAFQKSQAPSEITRYAQAKEALKRLSADAASFDLVVTDYKLPGMSGLDLCRELLKRECPLPLVLLTGAGTEYLAIEALKAGVDDYMIKDPDRGYLDLLPLVLPDVVQKHSDRLARKRAEGALRQRNRNLALLNQVGQRLTATLDLEQVVQQLLQAVAETIGVEGVSLWLWDEEREGWLVCRAVSRHDQGGSPLDLHLRPGQGIAGWVAQTEESAVVANAPDDPRFFPGIDEQTGWRTTSLLAVPLRVHEAAIGVLEVVNKLSGDFDGDDLTLVETLAASAAIAIENARLHQALLDHAEQLEQRVQERTAEIQAQYALLEAILYSASDGIVVTDGQGEILQANPIVYTWLTKTLSLEDAARLREAVQYLARRVEERPQTVLELTGLDLKLRAAPISGPGMEEATTVVAIHDVSHLKALNRMKTRFVTNVSHELRTPVTTIKLYAHLMRQQPKRWEEYLEPLTQETDHLARLVENIMQISRIDAGRLGMEPRPTPLNELTEAAVASHQVLAQERGLTLEHRPMDTSAAEPGPAALVDPERMMQVLNNLVENAIHYTPEGGTVVVFPRRAEAEGRAWATVTVADTGMGIPEDELPHVFERFFRGEGPQAMQLSGTGLGLAIVQEIVELHGGQVTVESPSTEFVPSELVLSEAEGAEGLTATSPATSPATSTRGGTRGGRTGEEGVGSTFTVWLPLAD